MIVLGDSWGPAPHFSAPWVHKNGLTGRAVLSHLSFSASLLREDRNADSSLLPENLGARSHEGSGVRCMSRSILFEPLDPLKFRQVWCRARSLVQWMPPS